MKPGQRVGFLVNFLRLTLVAAIAAAVFYGSLYNLFISVITLLLTFLPTLFEKTYKIDIPLDLAFASILFVYASLFLGETHGFYERFWWWDIMLHASSAVAFAITGFIVLFILLNTHKVSGKPIWVVSLAFCFSVTIGVFWEIFEFAMDQLFGYNMQKSGLADTMMDLISNCVGAALASLGGFAYMKGQHRSYLARFFDGFFRSNPSLKSDKPSDCNGC